MVFSFQLGFRIPMRTYMSLAFYTVVTMGLSNAAVGYLNVTELSTDTIVFRH